MKKSNTIKKVNTKKANTKKTNTKKVNVKKAKETREQKEARLLKMSMRSNKINCSNANSKTGVCCNNIQMPNNTCREDAPCKISGKCYCMKGRQQYDKVQQAYWRNWRLYNEDSEDFFEQVIYELKHSPLPIMRWFDSGDIPDSDFFDLMVHVALKLPNIKFMSFTKKYWIVNDYLDNGGKLPDNLNIIFSAWDKTWIVDNPHNLPVAYVDFKNSILNPDIPKNAYLCPCGYDKTATCSMCQACWNKKLKAVKFLEH